MTILLAYNMSGTCNASLFIQHTVSQTFFVPLGLILTKYVTLLGVKIGQFWYQILPHWVPQISYVPRTFCY